MILTSHSTIATDIFRGPSSPDSNGAAVTRQDARGSQERLARSAQECLAQRRQLQFEVTRYIDMLLGELATMAKAADLKPLLPFLDATRSEAGLAMQRYRTER